MRKTLFIIASDYPFGPGEPFLENEVQLLEKSFDKIIFLVTSPFSRLNNEKLFYIPDNAEIIIINQGLNLWQKTQVIRWFFKKIFWNEIKFIRKKLGLKINLQLLKVCLFALAKGFMFKKRIQIQLKAYINSSANKCYFYSYWCTEYTLGLAFLKLKYPVLTIFTRAHGWDVYFERNTPPYLPFRQFILDNINTLFTISENGKKYLENKLIDNNKKLWVSKLGVFESQMSLSGYVENDTLKILSLAYINPVKRLLLLVDAISLLNIKTCWTHIGGSGEYEKLLIYSKEKLTKPNINFRFLGNLSKAEIYKQLQNNYYDFLINTSYTEGIPVSMMEAMSFGIPVIGTNVGGVCEIIDHEINGFLMTTDPTPLEIAETILKFQHLQKSEKLKFRENAYNTWKEKYNAEKNYKEFLNQIFKL